MCDNCIAKNLQDLQFTDKDYSIEAQQVLNSMISLNFYQDITFLQFSEFLEGKSRDSELKGHPNHGILSNLEENDIQRIILRLLKFSYLEEMIQSFEHATHTYIHIGNQTVLNHQIILNFPLYRIGNLENIIIDMSSRKMPLTIRNDYHVNLDNYSIHSQEIKYADIIEIFDDDSSDNFLLPSKRLRNDIIIIDENN